MPSNNAAPLRGPPGKLDDGDEDPLLSYQRMLQLVLRPQREALLRMRSNVELSTR